jgi:hypothetical protein
MNINTYHLFADCTCHVSDKYHLGWLHPSYFLITTSYYALSYLYGGSVGQPGVGSSTGDFEIWLKGALEVESLSLAVSLCGSSVEGTWRGGGSFSKVPEGYERKTLGTGTSLHGGSAGQPGVGSSTGDFQIWLTGALEVECPSLWKLCKENLKGWLPCW